MILRASIVAIATGALTLVCCSSFTGEAETPAGPLTDAGHFDADASAAPDAGSTDASDDDGGIQLFPPPSTCADTTPLIGSNQTDGSEDTIPAGNIDAFGSELPQHPVEVGCAHVWIKTTGVTGAYVGLYDNDPVENVPSKLLATAALDKLVPGWNVAPFSSTVRLPAGARVWLGFLPKSATITYSVMSGCAAGLFGSLKTDSSVGASMRLTSPFMVTSANPDYCRAPLFASP